MIKRFCSDTDWVELQQDIYSPTGYIQRHKDHPFWVMGGCTDFWVHADLLNQMNWKEVTAVVDPNDLQGNCDHRKWDAATDACALCGKAWNTILWSPNGNKPCCGGNSGPGPYFLSGGNWHSGDCDSLKPPKMPEDTQPMQLDYRPKPSYRCQCGAQATSNPNCHSTWCPDYRK